jgi:protein gp37
VGENSKIPWTHHTFNGWWGCVEVSPACDNCYARSLSERWGFDVWGKDKPRRFFGDKHWNEPLKWDRKAREAGRRDRVFAYSMADLFEDRRDLDPWRERQWRLVEATPNLDWMLLTKREDCLERMLPERWLKNPLPNVWLGTTAENERRAKERIPALLKVPAAVHWLSAQPLLGPINLMGWLMEGSDPGHCGACGHGHGFMRCPNYGGIAADCDRCKCPGFKRKWFGLGWVIVGGESGAGARRMDPSWATEILAQCRKAHVPYFFKQKGEILAKELGCRDKAGKDLSEWPEEFRVQEFPQAAA